MVNIMQQNPPQDNTQEDAQNAATVNPQSPQATPSYKIPEPPDIPIHGRFDKYRSPYWSGVVAALGARYAPRPFWRKNFDSQENSGISHFDKHKYAAFAGTMLTGVASLYAVQTYKDIKSILSEVVGWEFKKPAEDVNIFDLFKSKNSVVKQTMSNFVHFNARRFGINAVYFVPFIFPKTFKKYNLNGETGVDWGVAANAGYLFHDIIRRKMTPFEELQTLIDNKINHASHYADTFVATDLVDIYERHAEHDKNKSFMEQRGTPEWDKSMAVFSRMADLMNQSYQNSVPHEHAQFGFSKFTHILGTHKIDPDHIERAAAYVEIANRYGVDEVDKAEKMFERGATVDQVMQDYPLALADQKAASGYQAVSFANKGGAYKIPESPQSGFADRVSKNQPAANFTDRALLQKAALAEPSGLGV